MILTILSLAIVIICAIFIIADISFDTYAVGSLVGVLAIIALSVSLGVIIISHAIADNCIQKNQIQYEGLCKRYEVIKSEYEDVSKSDVIEDITEWNKKVYDTKYWTENPWTSWFNPKKIADNMKYIHLD